MNSYFHLIFIELLCVSSVLCIYIYLCADRNLEADLRGRGPPRVPKIDQNVVENWTPFSISSWRRSGASFGSTLGGSWPQFGALGFQIRLQLVLFSGFVF